MRAAAGNESRAAYLVLLTRGENVKALLFNAEQRYLTEVIDDPLTVDQLSSSGRRCLPPAGMLAHQALNLGEDGEISCFELGRH